MDQGNAYRLERLTARIKEIAVEIAPDYPGVADCDPHEQLYAIKAAYQGTCLANDDLHELVQNLRGALGMSAEELVSIAHELRARRRGT